jgi:hypothetical protein
MASTRLRKAFKYPSEDEDSSEPEGIDEEEQEQLIKQYIEADAAKTEGYKVISTSHPLHKAMGNLIQENRRAFFSSQPSSSYSTSPPS